MSNPIIKIRLIVGIFIAFAMCEMLPLILELNDLGPSKLNIKSIVNAVVMLVLAYGLQRRYRIALYAARVLVIVEMIVYGIGGVLLVVLGSQETSGFNWMKISAPVLLLFQLYVVWALFSHDVIVCFGTRLSKWGVQGQPSK